MTKEDPKFRNVGLLLEDHDKLRLLADLEQRSMARQLSVSDPPCSRRGRGQHIKKRQPEGCLVKGGRAGGALSCLPYIMERSRREHS
jgi:hypothetical protein